MKRYLTTQLILISLMVCCLMSVKAQAEIVTFSFTGIVSGNLDSTFFTNESYEILITGDTDDIIFDQGPDIPKLVNLDGTIELGSIGIGTFIEPLYVFNNQTHETVGFGASFDLIYLYMLDVGLDTYDLTTSFGPISYNNPFITQFKNIDLDMGTLTFDRDAGASATFEATVVPEPVTMVLLGLGGLMLRRRRVAASW